MQQKTFYINVLSAFITDTIAKIKLFVFSINHLILLELKKNQISIYEISII